MYKNHKQNYHSHTKLCGHAKGVALDYVNEAIKHGYTELGISEHADMSMLPNNNSRLTKETYLTYLEELEIAKEYANKNNIIFYRGLEIEYFPDVKKYKKLLKELDYLILGQHYIVKNGKLKSAFRFDSIEDIKIYVDLIINGLKTGYFKILAHPDLCFNNIKEPTKEMYDLLLPIIKLAKELDIPLELNANGIRKSKYKDNNTNYYQFKYPRVDFFKMVAKEGAKVIISSDAHRPEDLDDWAIEEAYNFARKYKLNVVYKLEI